MHDDIIPWRYPAKRELQFDARSRSRSRQSGGSTVIADPHPRAGAAVDLYLTIGRLSFFWLEVRLIAVLVQIAEIGAGIVGMNVFTRRNIRQRG